jgi:uncharacterized membrane protein
VLFSIISASLVASYVYSYGASLGGLGVVSALSLIIGLLLTIFAIIAMVKAQGYFEYKIPVVGNLAEKFGKKN